MKKRIAYDYLFNYFGGDTREGRVVNGANICLNIRAYKGDEEVLFEDGNEVKAKSRYLSDVFEISFDRKNQFIVRKKIPIDNLFRLIYGWDRIEAEVIGYSLDVICGRMGDLADNIPEEFKNLPSAEPVEVSEQEFRAFLKTHADDFDILDNQSAQVPSVVFYDQEATL